MRGYQGQQKQDFKNWCEKYRATCFWEIRGQELAIDELKIFLNNFPREKAAILWGPVGTGKTCLAYAAANERKFEIVELNASHFRSREELQKILKPVSEQQSFLKKGKIILVDEIDGLSSYQDKGGLPELLRLIEETNFPIIITANDIWKSKFRELWRKCQLVQLREVDYKDIVDILRGISKKEGIQINEDALTSIAVKAKGDVRAAINDLQVFASQTELPHISIDERDKEQSIFNALKIVFKELPRKDMLRIYDSVNMPLDEIFLWLEKNIPIEYVDNEELMRAYEVLSKADIFRNRTNRQRYWRFLIYQNLLLSVGISSAKKQVKIGFTKYERPTRILQIWMAKQKNATKKTIIEKYAKYSHMSKKKVEKEFFLVKNLLKNPEAQQELKLNEKEVEFINSIN